MNVKSTGLAVVLAFMILLPVAFAMGQLWGNPVVGEIPQELEDTFIGNPVNVSVEAWIENLEIPWALVFLPDGRALVSERPGRIRLIRNGKPVDQPWLRLADVQHIGEGGLMGLALHPEFPNQPFLYAMHTYNINGGVYNRIVRIRDQGETGVFDRVIFDKIPGSRVHNGGRIAFGPDGMLYVCTGDAAQPRIAQDLDNPGGKILRLTPDGGIPEGNPFPGSPVYSMGHRNPQGLAWHPRTGALFISEHGPSGEFGLRGMDTIKVIRKGGNYGWPNAIGKTGIEAYLPPLILWERATPPGGIAFFGDDLHVATLRSEALIRIRLEEKEGSFDIAAIDRLFAEDRNSGTYGRLRDAVSGPDGSLYVLTSNRDGRGTPRRGDDKILKLIPR